MSSDSPRTSAAMPACVSCGATPPQTASGRIYTVSAGYGIEPVCGHDCAVARATELGAAVWVTTKFHPEELR